MTRFKNANCETCRFADLIHPKCEQCNQGLYKPEGVLGTDEYQPTEWFAEILALKKKLQEKCQACIHHEKCNTCYCGFRRTDETKPVICKSCGKLLQPWTNDKMCSFCFDEAVKNHFLFP